MDFNYSLKPFDMPVEEIEKFKKHKFDFINRLNFSGTYYTSIRLVSSMFNELFLILNTNESKDFNIDYVKIYTWDFEKINVHFDIFKSDLQKSISEDSFNNIMKFYKSYIEKLTEISNYNLSKIGV